MNALVSLAAVVVLFLLAYFGSGVKPLDAVFGIAIPYVALLVFLGGLIYRILAWAKIPVPFRIPTTCGQEKSLPWIRQDKLENPDSSLGVLGRMALEVLFFRSLLRNTQTELRDDGRVVYATSIWLWLGSLAFHYSLLVILVRHLRFFTNPVPFCVTFLEEELDGFLQVGVPVFFVTSFLFIAALGYLLVRRLLVPQLRYISLASDYFPLFLLIAIGLSGFILRYIAKTDIVAAKEFTLSLASLRPGIPETTSPLNLVYAHLFLVSVLFIYFPFSKLMHMAGVFLSPTRNLANNNRMVRHVNPWDYPVKVHSYEEYEDDFREKMKGCGVPVDKE
jgi:nitrate reductase gamma subunit